LKKIFNVLIDSYIDNHVGIADHFLSDELAARMKDHLLSLYAENRLNAAGTGNHALVSVDQSVRSDMIYWLDRAHNNTAENDFFDLMDRFVLHLNATCFTGITGYEFHYTVYEKGRFYTQHLDQFRNNKSRAFSMIIYLNANWQEADGGELCIHHHGQLQHIAPQNGKSVFFKSSELVHEVLVTHKRRLSITGWLKTNVLC
jgi:SM-20-related protein